MTKLRRQAENKSLNSGLETMDGKTRDGTMEPAPATYNIVIDPQTGEQSTEKS